MKKTLPILALLLASCSSDVGRYQHKKNVGENAHYLVDTATGATYEFVHYSVDPVGQWKLMAIGVKQEMIATSD